MRGCNGCMLTWALASKPLGATCGSSDASCQTPRPLAARTADRLSLPPDLEEAFVAEQDALLRILEDQDLLLARGRVVWGHLVQANQILFRPDNRMIAIGSGSTVHLYDGNSGDCAQTLTLPGQVRSLAFSPKGDRLAVGGQDKTVQLWAPSTGRPVGPPGWGKLRRPWLVE